MTRASICVCFAAISCSCASFPRVTTCPASPEQPPEHHVIISDVDDTIKDTHVKLGNTHMTNPAIVLDGLHVWHPVAGMARLYQRWAKVRPTAFVYLSAGPRRYRGRLQCFLKNWGFPDGSIVLRDGGTLIPPHDYKTKALYLIVKNWSRHHFVLVGDSGEFDPECYGELAREFPRKIEHIYIRNISHDAFARYDWAFRDILEKSTLFTSPSEVANLK